MEEDFLEHLQKRIRNLQKRKVRLEGYQRIADTDPAKLNADQLAALNNRDSVNGPLKELTEMLAMYEAHTQQRAASENLKREAAVAAAEKRGRSEGRAQLAVVTRFLRLAAVKHQTPGTDPTELAAIDTLLQQLYLGDEASLAAADSLAAGSTEPVSGGVTYAVLRDLSIQKEEHPRPAEDKVAEENPGLQISFLQEDELDVPEPQSKSNGSNGTPNGTPSTYASPSPEPSKPASADQGVPAESNGTSKPRRAKKPTKPRTEPDADEWQKKESRKGSDRKRGQRPRPAQKQ